MMEAITLLPNLVINGEAAVEWSKLPVFDWEWAEFSRFTSTLDTPCLH
jgi:hypothetical protein